LIKSGRNRQSENMMNCDLQWALDFNAKAGGACTQYFGREGNVSRKVREVRVGGGRRSAVALSTHRK
jgi:hypothetical protein